MSAETTESAITFSDLALSEPLQAALKKVGYERPSPIQLQAIPHLLEGKDLLGVAQTGTGKTAAFALPLLSRLDLGKKNPQILVLAPTRELAIQVAEAFKVYARELKGFHVLPIYGGQEYGPQLRQLDRGAHVVVGTPGRVMDHIRRGSLTLDDLQALVLDEADEMLRMGFIDDVEWILQHTPDSRQTALFSATMPVPIRDITHKYLKDPIEVTIKQKTTTASTISQRYWQLGNHEKLDVLTRILECEDFDGVIIFVRTKNATLEVAEKLQARGFAAEALNGDIAQNQREKTITQLKKGVIDILIATDVAARGLDVERISHVINYDIPYDTESYVHRIGRTGRAGREGQAILFVTPREKRMLIAIERATKQKIEPYQFPSLEALNQRKIEQLFDKLNTERNKNLSEFITILEQYQQQYDIPAIEIAAAFASIAQGGKPFLVKEMPKTKPTETGKNREYSVTQRESRHREKGSDRFTRDNTPMVRYRLAVGEQHGVQKGDIVGAIANEGGIESRQMGKITILKDHSFIDLPEGMPKDVFKDLQKTKVRGCPLEIAVATTSKRDQPSSKRELPLKSFNKKDGHKKTHRKNDSPGKSSFTQNPDKPKAKRKPRPD